MGNLTLLTQPLNSTNSNLDWSAKKPKLMESSLLPINQRLHSVDVWDEAAIETRAKDLLKIAQKLWPAPDAGDCPF